EQCGSRVPYKGAGKVARSCHDCRGAGPWRGGGLHARPVPRSPALALHMGRHRDRWPSLYGKVGRHRRPITAFGPQPSFPAPPQKKSAAPPRSILNSVGDEECGSRWPPPVLAPSPAPRGSSPEKATGGRAEVAGSGREPTRLSNGAGGHG